MTIIRNGYLYVAAGEGERVTSGKPHREHSGGPCPKPTVPGR